MNISYELRLQEEFPFMRRDMSAEKDTPGRTTYQAWGCECSAGWYPLIRALCCCITNRYAEEGMDENSVDLEVRQIKEKCGTLRFYYGFRGISCAENESPAQTRLQQDIAELVRTHEARSAHICEFCGADGALRKELPWKRTLCDACYSRCIKTLEERKEKRALYRREDFLTDDPPQT